MADDRHQAPPSGQGGMAARVAAELRNAQTELDEFSIARMERAMIQQWSARAARVEPLARPSRRMERALLFGAALMGATVFGTLLGTFVLSDEERQVALLEGGAQFEMHLANGAVQRGPLSEGQTLESGRHGHVQVDIGRSRVTVDPQGRVRFDRIGRQDLQLTVIEGRIEAQFNPDHAEDCSMVVETRAARVEVVGTRFSVAVDGQGNTSVEVTEGVVEVVPRHGSRRRLAAGQQTEVLFDPGDATERAVREALTERLAEERAELQLDTGASEKVLAQAQSPVVSPSDSVGGAAGDAELDLEPVPPPVGREPAPFSSVRSSDRRLELARSLLSKGRYKAARRRLRTLSRDEDAERPVRAEALVLIAESYLAQGYIPGAADAYRSAAAMATEDNVGHQAVFALATVLEQQVRDTGGAKAAYQQYLRRAPTGQHAAAAQQALCRLGVTAHC